LLNNIHDFQYSFSTDYVVVNLDSAIENGHGVEKDFLVPLKEQDNKIAFEKEFVDLIASLCQEADQFYWWASSLSEKNIFISKLFSRMHTLACLESTLSDIRSKNIVILCSDQVLREQIARNYKDTFKVEYSVLKRLQYYRYRWLSYGLGFLKRCAKALIEYDRLWFVRRHLHKKKSGIDSLKAHTVLRTAVDHRNYKAGTYTDSYFKRLLEVLPQHNQMVLIFAAIAGNYKQSILRFKRDKDNLIIPTNLYLHLSDIFKALLETFFHRPGVRREVSMRGVNIFYLVSDELLRDIATSSFFNCLIKYYSCLRLAHSISIKKFIYTFENYAWEKMSILGLRRQDRSINIVGFQHAFISRNSFKYFPGVQDKQSAPFPDKIVTMGKRTQEIMKHFGNYPEKIFSLGCALRQEYLFKLNTLSREHLPLYKPCSFVIPLRLILAYYRQCPNL